MKAFPQLYQGLQTLCWMFATSLIWLTGWNFLQLELFSFSFCTDDAANTGCLVPGDSCASSLGRKEDLLALRGFSTLDLVVLVSSGPAADGRNLRASSCVSAWPRPLSMVLEISPRPTERWSLLESCDNIQRSLPFRLSANSKYWLTFARQPRKPKW